MKLCAECNPNIIETLWVDPADIITTTPEYEYLRENRNYFLSSKAAFTYSGYAIAQLKRLKSHKKWINNPENIDPPKQTDFISLIHNFTNEKLFKIDITKYKTNYRLIPYDNNIFGLYQINGYETFDSYFNLNTKYDDTQHLFMENNKRIFPLFIIKFNKQEYQQKLENWKNYWTWKKNRNIIRADLEEKYQYDTKHAAHTIRLLRTGYEILKFGIVNVKRPDAQELLDIRNGKWTYEYLMEYAESLDNEIRNVWYNITPLPKKPNINKITDILIKIQETVWGVKFNV